METRKDFDGFVECTATQGTLKGCPEKELFFQEVQGEEGLFFLVFLFVRALCQFHWRTEKKEGEQEREWTLTVDIDPTGMDKKPRA